MQSLPKIKVCGLTRKDVKLTLSLGADYFGLSSILNRLALFRWTVRSNSLQLCQWATSRCRRGNESERLETLRDAGFDC